MVIKVGINSFGRIGRVIFRTCCQNSEIEVSAINDPAIDLSYMCYLIKFDSTHGKYTGDVSHEGDEIKINDRPVKVFHHKAPADIPWHEAGVQYVVEASGMFTSVEKASGHLSSDGVRRVIVTAPSADAPMLILGVNEDSIQPDMKVVSCASSTLYCLAPIVKVLEDAFGVVDGFVTSIHAMTPSLKPLDGLCVRGKHWRDHRSIHQNIIPASTGACRALGRIVPACRDKLCGLAFRVPVVGVSVLDMCVRLNKDTTIDEISQRIEKLNNTALGNIIQVSNEKAVSSDFIGETHSCILDIDSSLQIKPNFLKLICWYENEYSYSCRVVDTVLFSERQFQVQVSSRTRVMYLRPIACDAINNVQQGETAPQNIRRQCVSFCVPNLQNTWSNMKPGSRSFIMGPSTANDSPKYQVAQTSDSEKKTQSIKSYIDRLTKCQCSVRQNKTPALETTKDPLEEKERTKAQECLRTVEKEISEMLNMTQNLLNKSSNRKLPSTKHDPKKSSEKELEEKRNLMRKNIIAKISDTIENIRKKKFNTQNIGIGGSSLILDNQGEVSLSTHEADSHNNSQIKLPIQNSSAKPQIVHNNINTCNVSVEKSNTGVINKYLRDSSSIKINLNHPLRDTNKSQIKHEWQIYKENKTKANEGKIPKVESSLLDRTNEKCYTDGAVSTVVSKMSENLINEYKLLNVTMQNKTKEDYACLKKLDEERESNSHNRTAKKGIMGPAVVVISNTDTDTVIEPISKEIKHRQYDELAENVSVNTLREVKNDSSDIGDELADNKMPEESQPLAGCSSSPIDNISEVSLCGVNSDYTDPSKKNNSYMEDIYDKLDSESVSDSGSSFQIHEKTSQVIRITDLTYSLEDLPRLDKICRVIEISDELSDKLFSPLDSENCTNTPGRTWSFQDLCERIKFDDFCNELFEKP